MSRAFLRIPPFPRSRAPQLVRPAPSGLRHPGDPNELVAALRETRVGGSFWAARPSLPPRRDLLLAPDDAAQLGTMLGTLSPDERARAVALVPRHWSCPEDLLRLPRACDPWWLAAAVARCLAGAGQELALVAALTGTPLELFGKGRFTDCDKRLAEVTDRIINHGLAYACPFSSAPSTPEQVIAQLAAWRELIDTNRSIDAIYGVARWKRATLDPLLWDGAGPVRHRLGVRPDTPAGSRIVAWKSRTAPDTLERLTKMRLPIGEIEDGMIRSSGLGANCVPPLSAIVDFTGVYFDPGAPSDLETILEERDIVPALCARARRLRERLVRQAISKYGQGGSPIVRPRDGRRRVLVTGQVEDDRSMLSGGAGCSNLALLARARTMEPNAWLIYKPHPDVEAGHRKGHVPDTEAHRFANEIERDAPITALIDSVDALHVITSLAGFEALLRGKAVTTHGVPFYAGWGLTCDLAPVPARRTRRRTLDELVAATLLLYPRYVDPVTRLPCPAEVLVERLATGQAQVTSPLVSLREWQGRLNRSWRRMTPPG